MLTIYRHGRIQNGMAVRVWHIVRTAGTVTATPGGHIAATGTLLAVED